MNDWFLSIGIAVVIMLAIPLIGKYIVEPYCKYCNKVLGIEDKEDRK